MEYFHMRYPGGKEKAVTFSFDDGVEQDARLAETIGKYGIKCTFNINSGMLGNKGANRRLDADEIKRLLLDKGHEIAIHGAMHHASAAVTPTDCTRDVLECRLKLEELFGTIIRGMAYPSTGINVEANGNSRDRVKRILSDVGVVYARTLGGDNNSFELPNDWLEWMPTAHQGNSKIFDYIDEFLALDFSKLNKWRRYPRLFYVWGHSYEYSPDKWDRLEKICDRLGCREDVWYATNIEIYDYVIAYNSLVISADRTVVYNPSAIKVWFVVDGEVYSVAPGETIKIR